MLCSRASPARFRGSTTERGAELRNAEEPLESHRASNDPDCDGDFVIPRNYYQILHRACSHDRDWHLAMREAIEPVPVHARPCTKCATAVAIVPMEDMLDHEQLNVHQVALEFPV